MLHTVNNNNNNNNNNAPPGSIIINNNNNNNNGGSCGASSPSFPVSILFECMSLTILVLVFSRCILKSVHVFDQVGQGHEHLHDAWPCEFLLPRTEGFASMQHMLSQSHLSHAVLSGNNHYF